MKTAIAPVSSDPSRPFLHLLPIVDFIVKSGNVFTQNRKGFYATQGGWMCDFVHEIDRAVVEEAFDLPSSVRFARTYNAILCDRSWSEIRGNVV